MHEKFGSTPMTDILAPAIQYAREGFPVSELISYYLHRSVARIGQYEGFKETYMPDGEMPDTGDIFKNPALAATYEKIAKGGRDAFYKGDIARTIDAYIKAQGDSYLMLI